MHACSAPHNRRLVDYQNERRHEASSRGCRGKTEVRFWANPHRHTNLQMLVLSRPEVHIVLCLDDTTFTTSRFIFLGPESSWSRNYNYYNYRILTFIRLVLGFWGLAPLRQQSKQARTHQKGIKSMCGGRKNKSAPASPCSSSS